MRRKSRFMLAIRLRVGTRCNGDFFEGDLAMTLLDLNQTFSTDDRCRELMERLRWPEGVTCPRCKDRRISRMKDYARFECSICEYQFTVTSGPIFHDSHLPLPVWFLATLLMCEAKKGMSASQIKRTIWESTKVPIRRHGISVTVSERQWQRLKKPCSTAKEMDEHYLGGLKEVLADNGRDLKEVVIGIKQRDGELRFFHAEDAKPGRWRSTSKRTSAKMLRSS